MSYPPKSRSAEEHGAVASGTPFQATCVVSIGEILWDLLPGGPTLGGAPFNVAAHLAQFGYGAAIISAVGRDTLGASALTAAAELGVDTQFIATNEVPTGVARVELDGTGTPSFELISPAAWQTVRLGPSDLDQVVASNPKALVFGTLAQRSRSVRSATERLSRAIPLAVRVYDANLRPGSWNDVLVEDLLRLAMVAKLNEEEVRSLASALGAPTNVHGFAAAIARSFGLSAVCVTRGERGACLWIEGDYFESDGVKANVVDTIGTGDAFTALLIDGLLGGADPMTILRRATEYSAFVASHRGAIPERRQGDPFRWARWSKTTNARANSECRGRFRP